MSEEPVVKPTAQNGKLLSKIFKLLFVLVCYSVVFHTLLIFAFWFVVNWEEPNLSQHILEWIKNRKPSETDVFRSLAINVGLFMIFIAQHTLLAERNLAGGVIHRKLFLEWKINGALYSLLTAIALNIVMLNWRTVPIFLWNIPAVKPWIKVVHVPAWMILYGTTLMQDMPELIGLNQAVFNNDATSRKSANFKAMLKTQRHLGLVPFFAIIITCEIMTLDRLLFLILLVTYTFSRWENSDNFHYINLMWKRKELRLSGNVEVELATFCKDNSSGDGEEICSDTN